jgi:hypothetical protein
MRDTPPDPPPEQQDGFPREQPGQRKLPGRPFQAGDERINRAGRPKKQAQAVGTGPAGPVDVLAEMEAILTRPKSQDVTDFQKKLRRLYETDFKEFMRQLTVWRQRKVEEAKADAASEVDLGTEQALAVLERFLREGSAAAHISVLVGDAWAGLSEEDRQTILAIVDQAPTQGGRAP